MQLQTAAAGKTGQEGRKEGRREGRKERAREDRPRYLLDLAPRLDGLRKSGLVRPVLLLVPPELCCRLDAFEDSELMSPRSPEVTELLPVRQGDTSLSNT